VAIFVVGVSISQGFSSRGLIIILCLPNERCSSAFFALSSAKFCLNGHNSKKNILHLKNKKRPAQIFMHKKSWGGSSSSSSRIVCYENCIVHAFFILMAAAELRK